MPMKPQISTLTASTVGILNAIRDNASPDYYRAVPQAVATTESIRAVGDAVTTFQARANEFIDSLINRIFSVVITSERYRNKFAYAKMGLLSIGETMEEVFIALAKAEKYDWNADPVKSTFGRRNPDVKSAFHSVNMKRYYAVTLQYQDLKMAFLTIPGVQEMMMGLVISIHTSADYDEYILFKYLAAQSMLAGNVKMVTVPEMDTRDHCEDVTEAIKTNIDLMHYMSTEYNIAKVPSFIPDNVYAETMMGARTENRLGVKVLANAFNMEQDTWLGRRTQVDSFSFNDGEMERLEYLFKDDPSYVKFTEEQLNALKTVDCLIYDPKWMKVFDNWIRVYEQPIAQPASWNIFYDIWSCYSVSPFKPVCGFTTSTPEVTSVTVSAPANASPNSLIQATANVTATEFASTNVVFSIDGENVTIDPVTGVIKFGANASGEYHVTATSEFDKTKTGTAAVTVA